MTQDDEKVAAVEEIVGRIRELEHERFVAIVLHRVCAYICPLVMLLFAMVAVATTVWVRHIARQGKDPLDVALVALELRDASLVQWAEFDFTAFRALLRLLIFSFFAAVPATIVSWFELDKKLCRTLADRISILDLCIRVSALDGLRLELFSNPYMSEDLA